jgi:hypothetical protein
MTRTALIDYDIVKYAVGFAADEEPLENALHSVKLLIHRIVEQSQCDEYRGYITGRGNFREATATIKPYKGNRDVTRKPKWFKEIHEYLVNYHDGIVVDGIEADDKLGMEQTEDTVIASIDKDLNMIPGWHYNWKKDTLYHVDEEEALLCFYKQLLTGDQTDNIPGVPKIGDKKAQAIINAAMCTRMDDKPGDFFDWIPLEDYEEELYWMILEAYAEKYERPFEAMMENAKLLWIQRVNQKNWIPKW